MSTDDPTASAADTHRADRGRAFCGVRDGRWFGYYARMQRTTISLPDDLVLALDREARRRGVSVSALAREAIGERLGRASADGPRELPFAALGRSGSRDTAERAEEILAEEWAARDR